MRQFFEGVFDYQEVTTDMQNLDRMSLSGMSSIPRAVNNQPTIIADSMAISQKPASVANSSIPNAPGNVNHNICKPVLVYKFRSQLSQLKTSKDISLWFKSVGVYDFIKEFKVTANDNLVIYPVDILAKNKLINNINIKLLKIRDLNIIYESNKLKVIIKGLIDELIPFDEELKNSGISKIEALKSERTGKELKITVATAMSDEKKEELLKSGYLYIGKTRYYIEQYKGNSVVQCRTCQMFGHNKNENECPNGFRCSKCGEAHKREDCSSSNNSCSNCKQSHSCRYRGCPVYQELKKKKSVSTLQVSDNFYTNQSDMSLISVGKKSIVGNSNWASEPIIVSLSEQTRKLVEQGQATEEKLVNMSSGIDHLTVRLNELVSQVDEQEEAISNLSIAVGLFNGNMEKNTQALEECQKNLANSSIGNVMMCIAAVLCINPSHQLNQASIERIGAEFKRLYNRDLDIMSLSAYFKVKQNVRP